LSNAALGDLDKDGVAEIAVTSGGKVSVWKSDGTLFPGWPQLIDAELYNPYNDVALADVIGNSDIEIVASGSESGNLNLKIWDANGVLLDSKEIPGFRTVSSPVVADLDNNGNVEILVSGFYSKTWDGLLFVWQMDGSQLLPWPISYHDPQRTGSLGAPFAVGGIAELPEVSGSSGPNYIALAGSIATALVALAAGAWYARRRWLR
jgi:WD40 repeat protein